MLFLVNTGSKLCFFPHTMVCDCRAFTDEYRLGKRDAHCYLRLAHRALINNGTARSSESLLASPHLTPKLDNERRTCGDYRIFNATTIPNRYPNVSDIHDYSWNFWLHICNEIPVNKEGIHITLANLSIHAQATVDHRCRAGTDTRLQETYILIIDKSAMWKKLTVLF